MSYKIPVVTQQGFKELTCVISDYESLKHNSTSRNCYILMRDGNYKKFNRTDTQSFFLIEGDTLSSALADFNTTPDHDMTFDRDDGWFIFTCLSLI